MLTFPLEGHKYAAMNNVILLVGTRIAGAAP